MIVARLLEFYDPFGALGLEEARVRDLLPSAKPIGEFVADKERLPETWHVGRIKHFVENRSSDPIEVDNDCRSGWFGPPCVLDGHHRLCAAVIRGDRRIAATYGGLVATLEWLKGKRKTCPVL